MESWCQTSQTFDVAKEIARAQGRGHRNLCPRWLVGKDWCFVKDLTCLLPAEHWDVDLKAWLC